MPIFSLRESDPKGELSAFPQEGQGFNNVADVIGQVLGLVGKYKTAKTNKAFRDAANEELKSGRGEAEYEYDPTKGGFKMKVSPKKADNMANSVNSMISRFKTAQQFGIDPVTGQAISPDKLAKPRFGYTGDIFSQIFSDPNAMAKVMSGGDDDGSGNPPIDPSLTVPTGANGAQPSFMDPLELEAQQAIAQGADPVKVRARLAQLKGQKSGGSI